MKMYCIHISPKSGIGYNYVVLGESPKQAISNLSYQLRNNKNSRNALEVIKVLRRPNRYTSAGILWGKKVEVIETLGMEIAYPYDIQANESPCNLRLNNLR